MPTKDEQDYHAQLLGRALLHYIEGEYALGVHCLERLAASNDEIQGNGDITVMFILANYIVQMEQQRSGKPLGEGSFARFILVDESTGEQKNPDAVDDDPTSDISAAIWCTRFVVATANNDRDMKFALLNATPSVEAAIARQKCLYDFAGQIAKIISEEGGPKCQHEK